MCTLKERSEAMMAEITEIVSGGDDKKLQNVQAVIGDTGIRKLGACVGIWADEMIKLEQELEVFVTAEHEAVMAEAAATLARCEAANISFLDVMLPGENLVKRELKLDRHMFWTAFKADPTGTLTAGNLIEKAQGFFKKLQDELVRCNN